MNIRTISFKVDNYTINLHRGKEEPEEIKQKRMALLINCLCNIAMRLMVKYFEEYYPELQIDIENIIQKHIRKNIKN